MSLFNQPFASLPTTKQGQLKRKHVQEAQK